LNSYGRNISTCVWSICGFIFARLRRCSQVYWKVLAFEINRFSDIFSPGESSEEPYNSENEFRSASEVYFAELRSCDAYWNICLPA